MDFIYVFFKSTVMFAVDHRDFSVLRTSKTSELTGGVLVVRPARAYFLGAPLSDRRTCASPLSPYWCVALNVVTPPPYRRAVVGSNPSHLQFPVSQSLRGTMKLSKSSLLSRLRRRQYTGRLEGFRPPLRPSHHLLVELMWDLHSEISSPCH